MANANPYRFCGQCGTERVSEDDQFCMVCGQEVRPAATPATTIGRSAERSGYLLSFFRSPKTRANWTLISLVAFVLVALVSFFSTIAEINLLQRVASGEFVSDSALAANNNRLSIISWLSVAAFVVIMVTFCLWIYRASDNLDALRVESRQFPPSWSVGWWFIQIFAVFRPYQVVKEIWKGSYPTTPLADTSAWTNVRPSPILGWWWGAWIVSNIFNNGVRRIFLRSDLSVDEFIARDYFSMAGQALFVVAAVLLFILVKNITSNQVEKHRRLTNALA